MLIIQSDGSENCYFEGWNKYLCFVSSEGSLKCKKKMLSIPVVSIILN